ncbi:PSME3-interacting protein [Aspergillus clavatus NRRL 1]|uniref:FAM192A/Fyv6 N-terminal domain-containing protein n=1 Tax=Aspergillus clavatus (strain ATCC 1007 / CBS 513.65 / DSM 816 / NCTC 3887 / NRRL 1 / QM 1276 / 107) TaxID=344612 RepID=A1CQC1_ASPCL|nr:uncharacterized protein ACLA_025590 [Aspergillus clavatus NRRL 1]EAW07842.1 conserved hypothetical protein [Aspergillus clavatus NRRL 1]
MSSGFVSAGTDQEPVERDDEWLRVQQELEEERRRKAELGKQDGGKSLFDVLQQNKMAKQEAFEEKLKLKNQFRSLDEDEVEFLDSIMESTRAQEAAVKKETAEQLEMFRRQREEAEKVMLENSSADVVPTTEGEDWKIPARKRRRDKTKDLLVPGKKRKSVVTEGVSETSSPRAKAEPSAKESPVKDSGKSNTAGEKSPPAGRGQKLPDNAKGPSPSVEVAKTTASNQSDPPASKPASLSLGLAGYSSDSE